MRGYVVFTTYEDWALSGLNFISKQSILFPPKLSNITRCKNLHQITSHVIMFNVMASKIKKSEWVILFVTAGTIDVLQWAIDFIPGFGEAANEILDPLLGVGLGVYFQFRGVNIITNVKRMLSLVGGTLAENLTASVAPAWFFDVWYIHSDVKNEEAETQAQKDQENMLQNNINQPLNDGGMRSPNQTLNGQRVMANVTNSNQRKPQAPLYGGASGRVGIGVARGRANK